MIAPRRILNRSLALVLAALLLPMQAACGKADATAPDTTLNVFAAASLTEAFTDIAKRYENTHAGTKVKVNFGSSSTLATQINNGAPADVFASADEANMKKALDTGAVKGQPQTFARNQLVLLVASGNPKKVATLEDLNRPGLIVAACAPEVPAGRYAREMFTKAKLAFPATASQELDVKQVVSRVALGEADAGIAYAPDGVNEQRVTAVPIPTERNVVAKYPAASVSTVGEPFVAFLLSGPAQDALRAHGFLAPA